MPFNVLFSLFIWGVILFTAFRTLRSYSIASRTIRQQVYFTENLNYISRETFFNTIEETIKLRNITGIYIRRETLKEGTFTSNSRKYLKVTQGGLHFYISTFPLGNTQQFSWWHIEPTAMFERLVRGIPLFGRLLHNTFFPKTLYRMDVSSGLTSIIESDLKMVLDTLTEKKGYRLSTNVQNKTIHDAFIL